MANRANDRAMQRVDARQVPAGQHEHEPTDDDLVVRCPDEPPRLSTAAARTLLALLLTVAESEYSAEPSDKLTA